MKKNNMSKNTKDNQKNKKEEALLKDVIEQINKILKDSGTVLMPYLEAAEYGIIPRVKVAMKPEDKKN